MLAALWAAPRIASAAREPGVALATVTGAMAVLASAMTVAVFGRRRRLDELLVALAVCVLAVTVVAFWTVPVVFGPRAVAAPHWGALAGTALGALLLAAGAVAPSRALTRSQAYASVLVPATWSAVAVVVVTVAATRHAAEAVAPAALSGRRVGGEAAMVACAWTTAVLFALAAVGFARRAVAGPVPAATAFTVAAGLAALARTVDIRQTLPDGTWVSTGDLLWLASWCAILAAAVRHTRARHRAAVVAAVLDERRRVARDLHDVLAQELAFLSRNIQRLDPGDEVVRRLEAGAGRALTESRAAITALRTPLDRPLDIDLAEAARQTADREGAAVALDLDSGVRVTPAQRDGLVRIASEAITNAIRHGDAELVAVELDAGTGVRLRVTDTGSGFHPGASRSGGFGLVGMRARGGDGRTLPARHDAGTRHTGGGGA